MALGNLFGGSSTSAKSSEETELVDKLKNQIRQELELAKLSQIIDKIDDNCFANCVSNPPGNSLSSGEQSCIGQCAAKYMAAWDLTSRMYMARIQQQQKQQGQFAAK